MVACDEAVDLSVKQFQFRMTIGVTLTVSHCACVYVQSNM